jgi:hypothetical protein
MHLRFIEYFTALARERHFASRRSPPALRRWRNSLASG